MKVTKGRLFLPSKHVIYGTEGVGKTELASLYPTPIFGDTEGSTTNIDTDRRFIKNWTQFTTFCDELIQGNDGGYYKTVIFDTVDWLEKIMINEILRIDQETSITSHKTYGFGAGDKRIEEFAHRNVIGRFNQIMAKGKNIVLTAHCVIKGIDHPIHGRFDTFQLKASKTFSSIIKEWCTDLLFIDFETQIEYKKGIEKNKATGGRERYIHTKRTPQYEAKNRSGMQERMRFNKGTIPYLQFIGVQETVKDKQKEELKETSSRLADALKAIQECKDTEELDLLAVTYEDLSSEIEFQDNFKAKYIELS